MKFIQTKKKIVKTKLSASFFLFLQLKPELSERKEKLLKSRKGNWEVNKISKRQLVESCQVAIIISAFNTANEIGFDLYGGKGLICTTERERHCHSDWKFQFPPALTTLKRKLN
jgi:hypothetical protein